MVSKSKTLWNPPARRWIRHWQSSRDRENGFQRVWLNKLKRFSIKAGLWNWQILKSAARNLKKYFPGYYLIDQPDPTVPAVNHWLTNFDDVDPKEWAGVFRDSVDQYYRRQEMDPEVMNDYVIRRIPSASAASSAV